MIDTQSRDKLPESGLGRRAISMRVSNVRVIVLMPVSTAAVVLRADGWVKRDADDRQS